jgi:hypothetical protein
VELDGIGDAYRERDDHQSGIRMTARWKRRPTRYIKATDAMNLTILINDT